MDTIAAAASPPGRGAVILLRISGGEVRRAWERFLGPLPPPGTVVLRTWRRERRPRDRVVAWWKAGPDTYTGEDLAEVSCHGNPALAGLLLGDLAEAGIRPARPGEFTFRAVLHGKMGVVEAQAVDALVRAGTERQMDAALAAVLGEDGRELSRIRERLRDAAAHLMARVDHGEEAETREPPPSPEALAEECRRLASRAREGESLRVGLRLVLVGRPNVGKSSCFNAWLGRTRALVDHEAGTTRDVLEGTVERGGLPVTLVDTAGWREEAQGVEAAGLALAREELRRADGLIFLYDASAGFTEEDVWVRDGLPPLPTFEGANKADLLPGGSVPGGFLLSARTGEGLESLWRWVERTFGTAEDAWMAGPAALAALEEAADALDRAGDVPEEELRLAEVQQALAALDRLFAPTDPEDLYDRVFSRFCVGK